MHYHMGRDMQRAFFLAGCSSALALFSLFVHAAVPSLGLLLLSTLASYLSQCYYTDLVAFGNC